MNTKSIFGRLSGRPLCINFDTYTDGDADFKKELIVLIVDNLLELQQALLSESHDIQLFHKVCHKVKATLVMLDDSEILDLIEQLKIMTNQSQLERLHGICGEIIDSLGRE